MKKTSLTLERKCLFYLKKIEQDVLFYCNGFEVLETLKFLPDIDGIEIEKVFLEIGEGKTYEALTENDFKTLNTFDQLKDALNVLSKDLFVYDLKFKSNNIECSIHDNREFNLVFFKNKFQDIDKIVIELVMKSFDFNSFISKNIFNCLIENTEKYILIDVNGKVVAMYKDFDEYLSIHQH